MTQPAAENGPVDLVVLGGGSGGYAAALRAAELGMSVVMIERDKVGGTCLHRGCIPTKALLHSAETVDVIKEAAQFGVNGTFESVDIAAVNAYKGKVVEGLYKGLTGLVKSRKIETVQGTGKLVSPTAVEVDAHAAVGVLDPLEARAELLLDAALAERALEQLRGRLLLERDQV
ncbi:MAG: FAD-dependent oxidoreductase, partial [Mycobacteriales bacterium]